MQRKLHRSLFAAEFDDEAFQQVARCPWVAGRLEGKVGPKHGVEPALCALVGKPRTTERISPRI